MRALEKEMEDVDFVVSDVEVELGGVYQWPVKDGDMDGIPVMQVKIKTRPLHYVV